MILGLLLYILTISSLKNAECKVSILRISCSYSQKGKDVYTDRQVDKEEMNVHIEECFEWSFSSVA